MGVDAVLFERLVELSSRFSPKGRTLMLGRQSFGIQTQFRWLYNRVLKETERSENRFDFLQEDGFSETLFRKLGFGEIETMDFSDYEDASILHDLNHPVDKKLHKKFDFIFDGGTIEHVFNVPVALENVFNMLKPGGRFVSANGMNGWVGHGIYQFSPELVWSFWGRRAKCNVIKCLGVPKVPVEGQGVLEFPDPADKGVRLRLRGKTPEGRSYLYYEVERQKESNLDGSVLQSDYETKWSASTNAGAIREDAGI